MIAGGSGSVRKAADREVTDGGWLVTFCLVCFLFVAIVAVGGVYGFEAVEKGQFTDYSGEAGGQLPSSEVMQLREIVADAWQAKYIILVASSCISLVLSLAVLGLLGWGPQVTVTFTTCFTAAGLCALSYTVWMGETYVKAEKSPEGSLFMVSISLAFLAVFLVSFMAFFLSSRGSIATTMMKLSESALSTTGMIPKQQLVSMVVVSVLSVFWFCGTVWAFAGSLVAGNGGMDVFWYTILGVLLLSWFWIYDSYRCFVQMVVSHAVGMWYTTAEPREFLLDKEELAGGPGMVFGCHIGSCFARPFLSFVNGFKSIFITIDPFQRAAHNNSDKTGLPVAKDESKEQRPSAGLHLYEKGYVQTALHGLHATEGAQRTFDILHRNASKVSFVGDIITLGLWTAKTAIAMLSTAAVHLFIQFADIPGQIPDVLVLVIIMTFVVSYTVADCCLEVYQAATMTLIMCFCEDCDINDGTPFRPYNMPDVLKDFVLGNVSLADAGATKRTSESKAEALAAAAAPPAATTEVVHNLDGTRTGMTDQEIAEDVIQRYLDKQEEVVGPPRTVSRAPRT